MKLPLTIDPRYHDAVLFNLDGALSPGTALFGGTVDLVRKLRGVGVAAAAYSASPQCQQALKNAGVDELFLDPSIADPAQVDLLADVVLS